MITEKSWFQRNQVNHRCIQKFAYCWRQTNLFQHNISQMCAYLSSFIWNWKLELQKKTKKKTKSFSPFFFDFGFVIIKRFHISWRVLLLFFYFETIFIKRQSLKVKNVFLVWLAPRQKQNQNCVFKNKRNELESNDDAASTGAAHCLFADLWSYYCSQWRSLEFALQNLDADCGSAMEWIDCLHSEQLIGQLCGGRRSLEWFHTFCDE